MVSGGATRPHCKRALINACAMHLASGNGYAVSSAVANLLPTRPHLACEWGLALPRTFQVKLREGMMVVSQHGFLLSSASVLTAVKNNVHHFMRYTQPKRCSPEKTNLWIFYANQETMFMGIIHEISSEIIQLIAF